MVSSTSEEEYHQVVVAGGGICGLATALALHRKGIQALVLEKSDTLRAAGAAIAIYANGWRALDQLGVGEELRMKANPIMELRIASLNKSRVQITRCRNEALRCLKRSDLIETMANNLPNRSIRFGCQIVAIETDPTTSFPAIHAADGSIIKAKVLIGCDGSNSVVAKSLGLSALRLFPVSGIRGFTSYRNGHVFGSYFLRLRGDQVLFGRLPITDKLVHWFVAFVGRPKDSEAHKDPHFIRDFTLELLKDFPTDVTEMVKHSDLDSLSLTHIRYRAPWKLLFENWQRGTTTVAGDAMHVMGPFLGQGGSAGLEDAVVLARCLARELSPGSNLEFTDPELKQRVGSALQAYAKERRLRVLRLSTQSFLAGSAIAAASWVRRVVCLVLLMLLFGGMSLSHTQYDCGCL